MSMGIFWPCRAVEGRVSDCANCGGKVGMVGTGGTSVLLKSGRLVKRVEYLLLTRSEVFAVETSPFRLGRVESLEAVGGDGVLIGLDIFFGVLDAGGQRDFFCRREKPFPLSSMLKLYIWPSRDVGAAR